MDTPEFLEQPRKNVRRRQLLSHAGAALVGGGLLAVGDVPIDALTRPDHLPVYGGYASAVHADRRTPPRTGRVDVVWQVDTTRKAIALTFDDGPSPDWTPEVLSILEQTSTKATFFMVGTHARSHGTLVAQRLAGHEVGNHTWAHHDLAQMTYAQSYEAIHRAHLELSRLWGREPVLLRPPYGHIGGSMLLAASDLGYRVVLWNLQMLESDYRHNPEGLVDYIAGSCRPGTIVLAHDTGANDRRIAINALPEMIARLRAEGFEFVTVSELMSDSDQPKAL